MRGLFEDVRERVMVYYSAQNFAQASPQMAATLENPNKPEELILLDDLNGLRMSFLDGGYVDQPWLLMQLLMAASQARELSYSASRDAVNPSN